VYPHGNITGYRVAYRRNHSSSGFERENSNVPASTHMKLFTVLIPEKYYRFFVWAKTKKGWGPASEEVVYTTDKKGKQFFSIKILLLENVAKQVIWSCVVRHRKCIIFTY
jgi:hypothetical protein